VTTKQKAGETAEKIAWFAICGFAFFSPWSIAGAQTAVIVGLLAWLVKMVLKGRADLVYTKLNLPILAYVITQIIAAALSSYRAHSLRAVGEEWLVLIFFLIVNNVREEKQVKKLFGILISVSALVGLYAVWQHYTGMDLYRGKILETRGDVFLSLGLFDHHLTFGGYYMLVFLLAAGLAFYAGGSKPIRVLRYASPVLPGLALVFSYARSAWLGALAGIFAFGLSRGVKLTLFLILGMVLLCLVICVLEPTIWDRIKEIDLSPDKPESTRIRLWLTSINMIKDRPILGIGPGNFSRMFDRYKVDGVYDTTCHPHNDYLNVAANSGILGLLAYLYIWVTFLLSVFKSLWSKDGQGFRSAGQAAGMAAISGFLIAGLLQCYYTDAEVNMLIMFILGSTMVLNGQVLKEIN
jgi:putative inorganic carbon (HCO3(-)) transporter